MIYPFKCKKCGEFELKLKMSEIPLKKCPHCGSKKVERIFTVVDSIWKVGGAYSKQNHGKSE